MDFLSLAGPALLSGRLVKRIVLMGWVPCLTPAPPFPAGASLLLPLALFSKQLSLSHPFLMDLQT